MTSKDSPGQRIGNASGILDLTDLPNVHYEGPSGVDFRRSVADGATLPRGQYSYIWDEHGTAVCARDPVGCNNLFLARLPDGRVAAANRIATLFNRGLPLNAIFSCPAGLAIRLVGDQTETMTQTTLCDIEETLDFDTKQFKLSVDERLCVIFERLQREFRGKRFVVCLSGGLDSSIVAYFAKRFLDKVSVVCFSYLDDLSSASAWYRNDAREVNGLSEDFCAALDVANALELRLDPVYRARSDVAATVPTAVALCQDWRDFNVHCAIVNTFLAQGICKIYPDEDVVVLTGDLMNEYLCDYREEVVEGEIYYPQPRLKPRQYRRFLVRGLDAGDREIGVFNHFGLPVCQPYAGLGDLYMTVPSRILETENCKEYLNGDLLPATVKGLVNPRKTRAQVGGRDMGTLGICHSLKYGSAEFLRIWSKEFPGESDDSIRNLISIGRYRTTTDEIRS